MASNKGLIIAGVSLIVASAGLGTYLYIRSRKKSPERDQTTEDFDLAIIEGNSDPTPVNPTQSEYAALPLGNFPIQKGQKSKLIWIFQDYLNCRAKAGLDVDGHAGNKTEQAMIKYLGKNKISSMDELKTIVGQRFNVKPGSAGAFCESRAEARWNQARRASSQLRNFINFA